MNWNEDSDHENKSERALVNVAEFESSAHKKWTVRFTSVHDQLFSYNKAIRIHLVQPNIKVTTIKNDIK